MAKPKIVRGHYRWECWGPDGWIGLGPTPVAAYSAWVSYAALRKIR